VNRSRSIRNDAEGGSDLSETAGPGAAGMLQPGNG
jgi:hypothetical protein